MSWVDWVSCQENIIEMNNGCICCTVRGDLIAGLKKMVSSWGQRQRFPLRPAATERPNGPNHFFPNGFQPRTDHFCFVWFCQVCAFKKSSRWLCVARIKVKFAWWPVQPAWQVLPPVQWPQPHPTLSWTFQKLTHHAKVKNSIKNNKPLDGVWAPRIFVAQWIFPNDKKGEQWYDL